MLKLVVAILLSPLVLKGLYVNSFVQHYTGDWLLGFTQVLAHDALWYGVVLALLWVSILPTTSRFWGMLCRLLILLLFIIYVADYIVIRFFNTHLTLGDTLKYADYAYTYLQQSYGFTPLAFALIVGMMLVLLGWLLSNPYRLAQWPERKWPLLMLIGLPLTSNFADDQKYAHSWIYKNVLEYNLTILSEAANYSEPFLKSFSFNEAQQCQAISPQPKNIIILMVESLSAYQSQYFSGIQNWTPNLDRIAQENLAFKNFYANGFITEDGEIALLTGLLPLYPPSSYTDDGATSFYSFYGIEHSLPNILKKQAYRSEFLTTADLDFGNTGIWAKSIGFDYVEGHDHPDYDHWERFHFQAAPDEALYQRALERIKQQRDQRFLMFIKTVSSHHPYIHPVTRHKSEAEVIQYTDQQLGAFYRELQQNGFFENGLLVIVGDHHSMTPLRKAEFDLYGQNPAAAKVPLVIVDGSRQGVVSKQFQQIDVFNTLDGMVSGRQCHSDWQGVLWGDAQISPEYIVHRRGDNRDMVSVFTEPGDFLIKLDGDRTRLAGPVPAEASIGQGMVAKINALRIARSNWAKQTVHE